MVQLPIEVEATDRSVVLGECGSVWLIRRGGESKMLMGVLEVIDLRGRETMIIIVKG